MVQVVAPRRRAPCPRRRRFPMRSACASVYRPAKNTLAIWSEGGLILRDLRQPARALRSAPGEIVKFNLGAPANAQSGALSFRGTISLDLNGRKSSAWQYVSVAVPGAEPARVTSNGKSARGGRPYRGGFEVFPQQLAEVGHRENALSLVNVVNIEDYLKGVVPWEMDATAPLEALKAQAMGARTKALDLRQSKRFAAGKFDICDYDACQGYPGVENEKPTTSRAVDETRGLAIYSGGRLIDSVFFDQFGRHFGQRERRLENVGRNSLSAKHPRFRARFAARQNRQNEHERKRLARVLFAILPSFARPTDAERANLARRRASNARVAALYGPDDEPEFYRWKRLVSVEDALSAFQAKGFAQVTNFEVAQRAASGHIRQLRVVGYAKATPNATVVTGTKSAPLSLTLVGDSAIRAMFSGRMGSTTALPSSTFVVDPKVDGNGKLLGWQLSGAGWGHGVGMCQRGAQNHASAGWNARQIIDWYYQNIEIRKLY